MALPRTLQDMMLFNEGNAYIGQIASVTLPKLTRKLEAWRGGGMHRGVKLDLGANDDLDLEFTAGGPLKDVLKQYGVLGVTGVYLRFAGYYRDDETGEEANIDVIVRGRHEEIDMGEAKLGEMSEFKVKTAAAYYRLDWNDVPIIEDDPLGRVLMVDGVDLLAGSRRALGV